MKTPLFVRVQRLLPQRALCRFIYIVSRAKTPWLKNALIRWFAGHYPINLSEAAQPELSAYESFNDFFSRALNAQARPIDSDPGAIVSPADGRVTEFGTISSGKMLQAKGVAYSPDALLRTDRGSKLTIDGAHYATIYLAPHDYHRVHMPVSGRLTALSYIAGSRFSVNQVTAAHIPHLFCRNERLVCWFDADFGKFAMVLVGALNVSSISTRVTGEIRSGSDRNWTDFADLNTDTDLKRGEEFATFNLGSTVILVLPNTVSWSDKLEADQLVRVGLRIGSQTPAMP